MNNKRNKLKSIGTNFKLIISIFIIFILIVSSLLFIFDHTNYIDEKKEINHRVQYQIDNRITSVKSLLNYTFFDEEFQKRLLKIVDTADQNDYKKIYEQLTSVVILGEIIKDIWYFPEDNNGNLDKVNGIFYSDDLMYLLDDVFKRIEDFSKDEKYLNGEYFFFKLGDNVSFTAMGHYVLSSAEESYFNRIGVSVALINTAELVGNFIEIEDMNGVNMYLTDDRGEIYYTTEKFKEKDAKKSSNFVVSTSSQYFGLKTVLYFPWYQTALDFLLYFLGIVLVCGFLGFCFLFYIKLDDKKRLASYNSFLSAFRKIEEGEVDCRIENCENEDLKNVANQFNLMMDSLISLNNRLNEEEKKRFHVEIEKDEYIIKYLTTQMNKHFIFNTFGTIRSFITLGKKKESVDCINWLCDYLRFTLKSKDYVNVLDEINALDSYLNIQRIRFPNIKVDIHLEDGMLNYMMPQFILQPLVENIYKHAFDGGKGEINIKGMVKEKDKLHFEILDNGKGIPKDTVDAINRAIEKGEETVGNGNIGLINVKERLKMLSSEAILKIESIEGKGTVVIIEFLGVR